MLHFRVGSGLTCKYYIRQQSLLSLSTMQGLNKLESLSPAGLSSLLQCLQTYPRVEHLSAPALHANIRLGCNGKHFYVEKKFCNLCLRLVELRKHF
jgi:hypothetical protein